MLPEMHEVESSNLNKVGYDKASSTLYVEFKREKGGQTYSYGSVSHQTYQELLEADSVGEYFAAHIRGNPSHPAQKLAKPEEQSPPANL